MSKPFMITYDLNNPGQRYEEVISTIKNDLSNGQWCKFWESAFLLRSELTPSQMIDKLKPFIDSGDKFFVTEIVDNYSGWLTQKEWDYIRTEIFNTH